MGLGEFPSVQLHVIWEMSIRRHVYERVLLVVHDSTHVECVRLQTTFHGPGISPPLGDTCHTNVSFVTFNRETEAN